MNDEERKHDPFYGAIESIGSEFDYRLTGGKLKIPKADTSFYDREIQYHQPNVSPVSCTIFANLGAVSDLTGHVFSLSEQKKAWKEALRLGANPKVGWYIHLATDVVRRQFNKDYPKKPIMSFQVVLDSEEFYDALEKGYSVVTGYSGNSKYNFDIRDGVLHNTSFGRSTYGHAIRIVRGKDGLYHVVVDNYIESKKERNVYKFKKENLKILMRNKVFFKYGYVFFKKVPFESENEFSLIPLWGRSTVEKCSKSGLKKDWKDYEDKIGDEKLENELYDLGILNKKFGDVSVLRFYVAMDRLGHLDYLISKK